MPRAILRIPVLASIGVIVSLENLSMDVATLVYPFGLIWFFLSRLLYLIGMGKSGAQTHDPRVNPMAMA